MCIHPQHFHLSHMQVHILALQNINRIVSSTPGLFHLSHTHRYPYQHHQTYTLDLSPVTHTATFANSTKHQQSCLKNTWILSSVTHTQESILASPKLAQKCKQTCKYFYLHACFIWMFYHHLCRFELLRAQPFWFALYHCRAQKG